MSKFVFFCSLDILELLSWNFSVHKWLLRHFFPEVPRLLPRRPSPWTKAGSECVCLSPDAYVGETYPESFGGWCWVAKLSQKHFCSWIDAKLLLWEGHQWGASYSAMMLTSLLLYYYTSLCHVWFGTKADREIYSVLTENGSIILLQPSFQSLTFYDFLTKIILMWTFSHFHKQQE